MDPAEMDYKPAMHERGASKPGMNASRVQYSKVRNYNNSDSEIMGLGSSEHASK